MAESPRMKAISDAALKWATEEMAARSYPDNFSDAEIELIESLGIAGAMEGEE